MTIFQVFFRVFGPFSTFFDFFWASSTPGPRGPGNPFSDFFRSFLGRGLFDSCRRPTMSQQKPGNHPNFEKVGAERPFSEQLSETQDILSDSRNCVHDPGRGKSWTLEAILRTTPEIGGKPIFQPKFSERFFQIWVVPARQITVTHQERVLAQDFGQICCPHPYEFGCESWVNNFSFLVHLFHAASLPPPSPRSSCRWTFDLLFDSVNTWCVVFFLTWSPSLAADNQGAWVGFITSWQPEI